MTNKDKYWRSEYEGLRRKKNKEIAELKGRQARFAWKTYNLLILLGMPPKEILTVYKEVYDYNRL